MKVFTLTLIGLFLIANIYAQSYTNWIVGDPTDSTPSNFLGGIVLAGGGTDNNDAMAWMLARADGGDAVVIRASNSDGYNNYFFSELGVSVNSVETIRFDGPTAAEDPYVIQQIRNAEVLFIAGGDQFDYYEYWKDTPIQEAINYLINEKGVTVGGTSAGMAILGGAYYTPSGGSLQAEQALSDPFHPNINILGKDDFINAPFLTDVITDTHFDQRERRGRHITFLARIATDYETQSFGIACNEVTAVCIDENGIAQIFGEYPEYGDYAYFLKSNCQEDPLPEIFEAGQAYTWNRNQSAVKVYQVPGTISGNNTFDLNDWTTGTGGEWHNWYVDNGVFHETPTDDSECNAIISSTNRLLPNLEGLTVFPNPFQTEINLTSDNSSAEAIIEVNIYNQLGDQVGHYANRTAAEAIQLQHLPNGIYRLAIHYNSSVIYKNVVKQ